MLSRGGDSLQGRYFRHRLGPLTLAELVRRGSLNDDFAAATWKEFPSGRNLQSTLETLLQLGGFPEPFLAGSQREAGRWRLAYNERLVREDLRTLEMFQDLDKIELLNDRLASSVGSLHSVTSFGKNWKWHTTPQRSGSLVSRRHIQFFGYRVTALRDFGLSRKLPSITAGTGRE